MGKNNKKKVVLTEQQLSFRARNREAAECNKELEINRRLRKKHLIQDRAAKKLQSFFRKHIESKIDNSWWSWLASTIHDYFATKLNLYILNK